MSSLVAGRHHARTDDPTRDNLVRADEPGASQRVDTPGTPGSLCPSEASPRGDVESTPT